jgi:hypothetical protein
MPHAQVSLTAAEIIAIIVTIGGVIVTPTLAYLTLKATRGTAVVVSEIKHEVNSRTTALMAEIDTLKQRIAELIQDREKLADTKR